MSYAITGAYGRCYVRSVDVFQFFCQGQQMLSLRPLYLDRSTDKTLWLTRHGNSALEIQSPGSLAGKSKRSYEKRDLSKKWNHQILSTNPTQSGDRSQILNQNPPVPRHRTSDLAQTKEGAEKKIIVLKACLVYQPPLYVKRLLDLLLLVSF